jgi:hypothetical protein
MGYFFKSPSPLFNALSPVAGLRPISGGIRQNLPRQLKELPFPLKFIYIVPQTRWRFFILTLLPENSREQ